MSPRKVKFPFTITTLEIEVGDTPEDIREWLKSRNWSSASTYGYWTDGTHGSCTWEQAVAIEFYKFITIGGHGNG